MKKISENKYVTGVRIHHPPPRRTAITTMLCLGMKEQLVRQISGHASNSKEFYKYVTYSQAYLDNEISKVHSVMEREFEMSAS